MNSLIKQATLIEVGDRQMTSDGKFHANLLADLVIKKAADGSKRNKWVSLKEAANAMYRSGSLTNQEKIRVRMSKLADELKTRGYCLVLDGEKNFKIYEGSQEEKEFVLSKHKYWESRARKAGDWSQYLEATAAEETEASESSHGGHE